jgi:hypothetical protein
MNLEGVNLVVLVIGAIIGIALIIWQVRKGGGAKKTVTKISSVAKTVHIQPPVAFRILGAQQPATVIQQPESVNPEPVQPVQTVPIDKPKKYPAMVISPEGIRFDKIPEKIGNIHFLEPSMPKHGPHFLVLEPATGVYEPFEPRDAPVLSNETPQKAYRAIRWPIVKEVFKYQTSILQHLNTILVGLLGVGMIIVLLSIVDKIGKK